MSSENGYSKHQIALVEMAGKASHLSVEFFYAMVPYLKHENPVAMDEDFVLWQLNESCHLTSESVLLLMGNVKLWDADALMRSVAEGTMKFVYLTLGTASERKTKFYEFNECQAAFGRMKRHQRLTELLNAVENPDAAIWRPYLDLLLNEYEFEDLKAKYPRKLRQQIEQKWSFSAITSEISKSQERIFERMIHLMFTYGMSSHIIHQDIDGIGMVWDRNRRDDVRREAVELAHGARLVSDLMIMALLRAIALFRLKQIDRTSLSPLVKRVGLLHRETSVAEKEFLRVEYGDSK